MRYLRRLIPERWRWRIVEFVGRRPGQCWSDLCDWAGGWKNDDPDGFAGWPLWAPWRPDQTLCRASARECGSCYCGKLRIAEQVADAPDGLDGWRLAEHTAVQRRNSRGWL